jgi:hypothetical protein
VVRNRITAPMSGELGEGGCGENRDDERHGNGERATADNANAPGQGRALSKPHVREARHFISRAGMHATPALMIGTRGRGLERFR